MASYLSEEWFRGVGAAAGEEGAGIPDPTLVLQHLVDGGPDGAVCYHVRVTEDEVEIVRGAASRPDVSFVEDYQTAAAIAQGTLSAPTALMAGRIRVGGDIAALFAHQDLLTRADPIPAAVRAETTY